MGLYPKPHDGGQRIQSDISTFKAHKLSVAMFGLGDPAVADNDSILAITALEDGAEQVITTFVAQPDFPRTLTIKGGQGGLAGDVLIKGLNVMGQEIEEIVALSGVDAVAGLKAFFAITEVTLPAWTTDVADTVSIGFGSGLALPYKLGYNTVFSAYLNGNRETTAPTVTFNPIDIEENIIQLDSALAGVPVEVILGI